jgi:hypothetical protein
MVCPHLNIYAIHVRSVIPEKKMRRAIFVLLLFAASAGLFAQSSAPKPHPAVCQPEAVKVQPYCYGLAPPQPITYRFDWIDGSHRGFIDYHPAIGDFNGDGNADFVAPGNLMSEWSTPVLYGVLGRGNGAVLSVVQTPLPVKIQFGTSGDLFNAFESAVGDFNGDGKQDAVFLTFDNTANYLTYFAGKGDGTFSSPVNMALPAGDVPLRVETADFNKDGHADLAVLSESGDLLIYLGKGDGTFQDPVVTATGAKYQMNVTNFAIGDVNSDGFPDLLLYGVFSGDYAASILMGNGDGTFQAAAPVAGLPTDSEMDQQFILADLNGDGKLDILAYLAPTTGPEMLFLAGDGKGGFAAPVTSLKLPADFASPNLFSPPALVDLDQDGKPDLAFSGLLADTPAGMWATGNGDGTFSAPSKLTGDYFVGTYGVQLGPQVAGLFASAVLNTNGPHPLAVYRAARPAGVLANALLSSPSAAYSTVYVPTSNSQAFALSYSWINFGNITIGEAASQGQDCDLVCQSPLQITSRGINPLAISSITTQEPFSQLNDCPSALAPGDTCEISAEFAPTTEGFQTGNIAIATGSKYNPLQVVATGTGVTPTFSVQPASLTFGYQKVGTSSDLQTVTLTNLTGVPQQIWNIHINTVYAGYFAENDDCSLEVVTSCSISIRFTPLGAGSITANVEIIDSLGDMMSIPITATAYSTGPVMAISPASLDFGKLFIGTSSTPQSVTLSNSGDAPILIASIAAGTGFTALNACGSSIQPGASCSVGVFVDTSSTGSKSGSLTITDNAPDSPQKVTLSGTVQSMTIAASTGSSTSASVTSGGTVIYSLTITPVAGLSGSVAIGCENAPVNVICLPSPASLTLDGKTPANVQFYVRSFSASAATERRWPLGRLPVVLSLSVLLFLFPKSLRKGGRWMVLLVAVALTACFTVGCGGSSSKSINPPSSQTYTLTTTFTVAGGGSVQAPLKLTITSN